VLEPVCAYLLIAERQFGDPSLAGCYNVGPDDADCYTTGELVELFCDKWNSKAEEGDSFRASWKNVSDNGPHEAGFLKLDSSKLKKTFGWKPVWNVERAMEEIVGFGRARLRGEDVGKVMTDTVKNYLRMIQK
jgi:CDP-glucose 4,6-dehydratase